MNRTVLIMNSPRVFSLALLVPALLLCFVRHVVAQIALINVGNTTNWVSAVAVSGKYAYVAGDGLRIYDVSNPANPVNVGYNSYGGNSVAVYGHYAYVASSNYGLLVMDASDPANPSLVGGDNDMKGAGYVAVSGHYLYLTESGGVDIYDLSNPAHPPRIAQVSDGYLNGGTFSAVTVSGHYLYVANGGDGLRIYDVANPANPTNVGYVPDYNGGFGSAVRVAISGHYAYLANTQDGLRIYDVSNPAIPINVGYINNGGYTIGVAAAGNYAYVVNAAVYPSGLRIYDMSNPVAPVNVGQASGDSTTSDVVVSGDYAYVISGTRGLRIYSVLPQLNIGLITNGVRLSWCAPAPFVVQQNPDLKTTNWVSITNELRSAGSEDEVIVQPPTSRMFYRLLSQ